MCAVAHGDERRWRSSIADRVEDETHRTTEPTGETQPKADGGLPKAAPTVVLAD